MASFGGGDGEVEGAREGGQETQTVQLKTAGWRHRLPLADAQIFAL